MDETLLRIDRVAMAVRSDRTYYSGKLPSERCPRRTASTGGTSRAAGEHTLADPAGRLNLGLTGIARLTPRHRLRLEARPAHRAGRHRSAGAGRSRLPGVGRTCPEVRVPQRSRRKDRTTGTFRSLSANQRVVNRAHAALRAPGERANAQLKSWRVLRKIRSRPLQASTLVAAMQTLIFIS
ncbi:hypothetical protein [Kineococcus sp. SYSU DK005]|uniref:hypothetical protein n=1 Tax=Kineococcus sp. SYSU DK005 TaxID=3383126 RepID=UPI003D7D61DC